jgi:uncharacterized protein YndB with AHSA1/START domain
MRSTSTAVVKAPVERVWALLADHEGMSGWAPGMKVELERAGLDDRNGVGAVRRIRTPLPRYAIVEEIVGFEPQRRLAYKALAGVPLKNYLGEVELHRTDGGTRIDWTISGESRVRALDGVAVKTISRTLLAALVRQVKRAS